MTLKKIFGISLTVIACTVSNAIFAANSSQVSTPQLSTPIDTAIVNKERILYWLEKRGELAANATDEEKNLALTRYIGLNYLEN